MPSHRKTFNGMKYTIKGTNLELTPEIYGYIKKKTISVERLANHFGSAVEAHIEVARTTRHHRKGNILRAEITMHLPHKQMRAEATGDTIFEAIDKAKDELHNELERYKEKDIDTKKRGARKIKYLLQG